MSVTAEMRDGILRSNCEFGAETLYEINVYVRGRCPFGNQVYWFFISTVSFFSRSSDWDQLIKPLLEAQIPEFLQPFLPIISETNF